MIVPEYWSEAKSTIKIGGSQRTLMRFGWSDDSESDAHENAKQRVEEAISRLRAGEKVRPRDHKVPYNGAEGLPIREEIVDRHGDAVITRNSYGALCLNTPDVVFADIDVSQPGVAAPAIVFFLAVAAIGVWLSVLTGTWWMLGFAVILGAFLAEFVGKRVTALIRRVRPDPTDAARSRIEEFADSHRDWQLRLYSTPMGYRVLVMHDTFDPNEEAAFEFMKSLDTDPLYMRMCRNQKCFRARVSPKPWRIEMPHIRPRPGVWPIRQERMAERREWIRHYEQKAERFASCRYEATLGNGRTDRKCEAVRSVHDRYCKAEQPLPTA